LAAEALRLAPPDENAGPAGPADPDALAAAACAVLRRRRVMIKTVSDPWQAGSHPIRTAAGLLDARTGSVLDIAVLLAGVLERLGVAATLLLTPTTVLVGYRRREQDGSAPISPQEAVDLIQRGVMGMIDPDLAVSASAATLHGLPAPARSAALAALPDMLLAVPVDAARAGGAAPQPMLERNEDDVVRELDASDGSTASGDEPPAASETGEPLDGDASAIAPEPPEAPEGSEAPESPPAAEALPAPPAVAEWKRNLLDLSRRNPLISRTARDTVRLWVPPDLISRFEDLVNAGDLVTLCPDPYGAENRASAGAEERAAQLDEQRKVYVNLSGKECARRLQTMASSARTILAETGANNLYVTIGTLTWRLDGQRVCSPLILIPVNLEQEDDTYGIVLDEAGASTPNHSLLTRFKA
ncbi:PF13195 family protein, partial [Actinomyces massiliensis F0489]